MSEISNSIFLTIKKLLGVDPTYTDYDSDIITLINLAFNTLYQLGVGPKDGFSISDDKPTWTDYIQDTKKFEFVKSYIYIKVRLIFDPPTNSFVLDSLNRQSDEIEWRLKIQAEECDKNEQSE